MFGVEAHDRRGGFLDRPPGHIDHWPVVLLIEPACEGDLFAHGHEVDIVGVVVALGASLYTADPDPDELIAFSL